MHAVLCLSFSLFLPSSLSQPCISVQRVLCPLLPLPDISSCSHFLWVTVLHHLSLGHTNCPSTMTNSLIDAANKVLHFYTWCMSFRGNRYITFAPSFSLLFSRFLFMCFSLSVFSCLDMQSRCTYLHLASPSPDCALMIKRTQLTFFLLFSRM